MPKVLRKYSKGKVLSGTQGSPEYALFSGFSAY